MTNGFTNWVGSSISMVREVVVRAGLTKCTYLQTSNQMAYYVYLLWLCQAYDKHCPFWSCVSLEQISVPNLSQMPYIVFRILTYCNMTSCTPLFSTLCVQLTHSCSQPIPLIPFNHISFSHTSFSIRSQKSMAGDPYHNGYCSGWTPLIMLPPPHAMLQIGLSDMCYLHYSQVLHMKEQNPRES